jgi:hypothetical protein
MARSLPVPEMPSGAVLSHRPHPVSEGSPLSLTGAECGSPGSVCRASWLRSRTGKEHAAGIVRDPAACREGNGERGDAGRLATFCAPLHSGRSMGAVDRWDDRTKRNGNAPRSKASHSVARSMVRCGDGGLSPLTSTSPASLP